MSPAPTRALGIGGLFALAAIISSIACLDGPLALLLHGYRETAWVEFFVHITDFASGKIWYPLAVAAILVAAIRYRFNADREMLLRHTRAGAFVIAAMASSGIVINLLKAAIGRERPRVLFNEGTMSFHPFTIDVDASSFPSGHTQSIWAVMLSLSILFPPLRPLFIFVALMISASRVIIGAHYFSDIVGGAYFGIAAVLLWQIWFERAGVKLVVRF